MLAIGAVLLAMVLPALGAPATVNLAGLESPVTYGTKRIEQAYDGRSPDTFVKTSVVHLHVPLNLPNIKYAPECDYISYLRYRHRDAPSNDPLKADRIQTFMPGTIAGASSADQLARNVIFYSKQDHNSFVEFWALDRRSNCLDDQTGVFQAVKQNKASLALDYYYNKKSINGRTFKGFLSGTSPDTAILAELGLDRTSSDWYDVINIEIPDAVYRTTKHFASGHSLGGPLAAYFAAYDRDGNVNTTKDAGYNQAAGFIAYDSVLTEKFATSMLPEAIQKVIQPIVDLGFEAALAGFRSGILPRSLLTALPIVLNSEAAQLLSILGARATLDPKGEADVKGLPRTTTIVTAAQFFFSKTLANFATFFPSVFNYRATNEALVGAILGDRFQAFGFLQTSVGFGTGGSIRERTFPVATAPEDAQGNPGNVSSIGGLLPLSSSWPLAAVDDAGPLGLGGGPLYSWLNYDEIAADGSNVAKSNNGEPFVTAKNQVTSINVLNAALSAAPLDFTEHYYSTRTTVDISLTGPGLSKVAPNTIHRGAFKKRPLINILGSEGLAIGGSFGDLGNYVVCDGYNHLDLLLAARKQNLGRKELSSISTSDFINKIGAGVLP